MPVALATGRRVSQALYAIIPANQTIKKSFWPGHFNSTVVEVVVQLIYQYSAIRDAV